MNSKYDFDVPRSRGFATAVNPDDEIISAQSISPVAVTTSVRDLILHAILVRIAYDDDCTEEFRTVFDALTKVLNIDIPQDRLDVLTEDVIIGDKLQQFVNWLTNSITNSIIDDSGDIIAVAPITVIFVDAINGNLELTLPTPTTDKIIHVKKIDSSSNRVRILPNINETIDGQPCLDISTQYMSFQLASDGIDWFII